MRYFVELAYDGTNYHGWQMQPNAISIQQVLQEQFSVLFQQKIAITGCGRTDTGVHARQFFAHFDLHESIDLDKACFALNNMLPPDIGLKRIFQVHEEAHSRFDAISRTYQYFIHYSKDPFVRYTSYKCRRELDIDRMNAASKLLFNYQDFTSFSKIQTDTKTNNCEMMQAYWEPFGRGVVFTVQANRFLRNMVRAIVGTMLDVGWYKISPDQVGQIVEAKDRSAAGTSVPAHGLFLTQIKYPEGIV